MLAAESLEDHKVAVLHGSALDDELLLRAGVEYIDTFLALSDQDEENLMSALLVRRLSRHGRPIVLSNQTHFQDILDAIDIDLVVNPRQLAINALLRHIRGHSVMSVAKLSGHDAEISEIKLKATLQSPQKTALSITPGREWYFGHCLSAQRSHAYCRRWY